MGFLTGSSCLSHSPLRHSQFLSPSSSSYSSSSSQSAPLHSRNAVAAKKTRKSVAPAASLCSEEQNDGVFANRRSVILLGISVLPFLQLRARAVEGSVTNTSESKKLEQGTESEPAVKGGSGPNVFVSLLNGLGIFGAGVLGALYALSQKEKKAAEETIESLKNKMKEKEVAFVSAEKNFEARLQNEQEESEKQLKKAKDEQMSLVNQLSSANNTFAGLGRELNNEKRLCEELKVQVESLQSRLATVGEDKKALEKQVEEKLDSIMVLQERVNLVGLELKEKEEHVRNISDSLAGKELELKNLNSVYEQKKGEVEEAKNEIRQLTDEIEKNQKELELKNSTIDELNARIGSVIIERDNFQRKFEDLSKDYNNLKLNSEKQAASDAKLLAEKEVAVNELKEKLYLLADEARKNQETIAYLTNEREDLKRILDTELENVKSLQEELKVTHEKLNLSRNEVSDLDNLLQDSRRVCSEFQTEIFELRAKLEEAEKKYRTSLDEGKRENEHLANELAEANKLLVKTKIERDTAVRELKDSAENNNALQRELMDVYKKAETTAGVLEEEKQKVLSLSEELQDLKNQRLKDEETRKSREADLEEAIKSIEDMNQNTFAITRELEKANSRILSLENEKEALVKSMSEQKNITKEAQENLEDAHILVMKLGKERETLERRVKKLEEELASAKGEILRMRNQTNLSKEVVNDNVENPQSNGAQGNVTIAAKRGSRRRKTDDTS